MAHALETFENGETAFFTNRTPAWHRLGLVTDGALTAEEALKAAHLDWTVRKSDSPISAPVITAAGVTTITLDDRFLTWRDHPITREAEALGVVGKVYEPYQNTDAFAFLNAVADESGAVFETAGSLDGGKRVFMTMKMPETMLVGGQDPVDLYLVAYNSHDGSSSFGAAITPVRVVCQNTLTAGLNAAVSRVTFRHTNTIQGRVQQAREALTLSFKVAKEFQAQADALIAAPMQRPEYADFIQRLVPLDKKATLRMSANTEAKHAELLALWTAPTQTNIANTRWAAYNAVAEWADWARTVRGGDEDSRARRALLELTDGTTADLKVKALRLLSA